MKTFLSEFSHNIALTMQQINEHTAERLLYTNSDLPAVAAFYAASKIIGEDILTYENETIQLFLLDMRVSIPIINKVVYAKTLIAGMDRTLSVAEYFKVASEVFCDEDVRTDIIDYIEPAKLIWTILVLMAVYGAENLPLTGDALKFLVACLKSDGWTMPPFMLNFEKVSDFFEYYDEEYYNSIQCSENDLLIVCGTSTDSDPSDAKTNFMEQHKPILQYMHYKTLELKNIVKTNMVGL
jgi:hypothetical protein